MGMSSSFSKVIRGHYSKAFGPFNQHITLRNHSLVFIDAPGLVDEDYQRSAYGTGYEQWSAIPEGTVAFVKGVKRGKILFIPDFSVSPTLHRSESPSFV